MCLQNFKEIIHIQYPVMTICVYRSESDRIEHLDSFPTKPRKADLINKIYFYKERNGQVLRDSGQCILCNLTTDFRTYDLSYLYGTDMEATNQSLAYNHLAFMKISNYKSVVASCSTFKPPGEVPIGSTYRVLRLYQYIFLTCPEESLLLDGCASEYLGVQHRIHANLHLQRRSGKDTFQGCCSLLITRFHL